jgi:SAM-dependent methyltransferase
MSTKQHWESVYGTKAPESVSWYAPHLRESMRYIRQAAPDKNLAILDVGGGESTLVDDLIHAGYRDITVLDISATALDVTRRRLGADGTYVKWIAADILDVELGPASYDIWHDRAVFHFLTDDDQRRRYIAQVLKALKPGGVAIVGTFGPEGPEKCSGLQVSRYSPSELHDAFGDPFELLGSSIEQHTTPWGVVVQVIPPTVCPADL